MRVKKAGVCGLRRLLRMKISPLCKLRALSGPMILRAANLIEKFSQDSMGVGVLKRVGALSGLRRGD